MLHNIPSPGGRLVESVLVWIQGSGIWSDQPSLYGVCGICHDQWGHQDSLNDYSGVFWNKDAGIHGIPDVGASEGMHIMALPTVANADIDEPVVHGALQNH